MCTGNTSILICLAERRLCQASNINIGLKTKKYEMTNERSCLGLKSLQRRSCSLFGHSKKLIEKQVFFGQTDMTLPLYAKQLVGYWTTSLNSQIHKYNKHITFITISNQETDKFLNQRRTIVQIVYFTDFNKQLFVLSTCFDLHFETVILTTPTQQKISHTKTYAPGRGYTRSQRNVPLLLHTLTLTRGRLFRHQLRGTFYNNYKSYPQSANKHRKNFSLQ
jgi:hypothetical protein